MSDLEELKQSVQLKFSELRAALYMREKLLLRQIEVIAQQQIGCGSAEKSPGVILSSGTDTKSVADVKFLVEQEEELLLTIRSFGRFQLENMNLALQDIYLKNEDYITPTNDHETMYKCLQQTSTVNDIGLGKEGMEELPEAIVVDFSKNKSIIEHNRKHMNESIINITLQEAKELIRKAKVKRDTPIPPLNLEELDDELESSIAEAVSSLGGHESPVNTKSSQTFIEAVSKKTKKNRFKPKITINNCNGTINLRNISSLTINCATEEGVSAEIPLQAPNPNDDGNVEVSDNASHYSKSSKNTQKSQTLQNTVGPPQHTTVTLESSSTGTSTPTAITTSSSNYSSNCSSRSQSKKQKGSKKAHNINVSGANSSTSSISTNAQPSSAAAYPYEIVDDIDDEPNTAVTCDFYNRLLNEIKNSIKEKSKRDKDTIWITSGSDVQERAADSTCADVNTDASCSAASSSMSAMSSAQPPKRLILKNFENLKIILEANSDEETFHPVQIEQWLAEIISETDLEPMQNTDILEHSKIHNDSAGKG